MSQALFPHPGMPFYRDLQNSVRAEDTAGMLASAFMLSGVHPAKKPEAQFQWAGSRVPGVWSRFNIDPAHLSTTVNSFIFD